jgi:hypothetical protein
VFTSTRVGWTRRHEFAITVVDSDVESVKGELFGEGRTDVRDQFPDLGLVGIGETKDACDVMTGNDQRVTIRNRESIAQGDGGRVLGDYQRFLNTAKRAIFAHVVTILCRGTHPFVRACSC